MLSAAKLGQRGDEQGRDDGEVLRHVVGDGERRQRAARHQQLLADLDHLDELGRIGIEVDHVAGLARRLRARLHGDADIGLRQRRRVVGAVAAHGDQPALCLLRADVAQLVLGGRLGDEVVDAGLRGDRGGGDGVVAGDHHRLDAHAAQLREALLDVRLDHVLQVDDAEQPAAVRHGRAACRRSGRCARRRRGRPAARRRRCRCPRRWQTSARHRRRPCAACGHRSRRRKGASSPRTR